MRRILKMDIIKDINFIFKKYNTDIIEFDLENQKISDGDVYLLTLKFKDPPSGFPAQRNTIFNDEIDLFSNLFIEIQESIKQLSIFIIEEFMRKNKKEKSISIYLKKLKEKTTIVETEVNRYTDNLSVMKSEMALSLLMLKKEKEEKTEKVIPDPKPGSNLPFYNGLSREFKNRIIEAKVDLEGKWVINWDLPNESLLKCPYCGTTSPEGVFQCPACGLDFD